MLKLQAKVSGTAVIRYGWGDSTSKHGLEWYNTRYRFLSTDAVLQAARASMWLASHPVPAQPAEAAGDCGDGFAPDPDAVADELQEQRRVHSQFLFDTISLHTHVPQLMGTGRTSLADKVGAHVHSTLLECSGPQHLQDLSCRLNN